MNPYYKDYSEYLAELFGPVKVQKISVNAALGCPNRDGTVGYGGCIYCDNSTFSPSYCLTGDSVTEQIRKGKEFFSRKYPDMRYLAYFQSFTGTHSDSIPLLESLYEEAVSAEGVVGLVIGTRPDTLPDPVVDLLSSINRKLPVIVEIGAESCSDATLSLVNRHHTWRDVADAAMRLHDAGIECGVHLIAGLPGEDAEATLRSVDAACRLPISSLKMHQLQVIRGTALHHGMEKGEIAVAPYTLEEYLDLCVRIVRRVPRSIAIERFLAQSPPAMVVAPSWGLKNHEFTARLLKQLSIDKTINT